MQHIAVAIAGRSENTRKVTGLFVLTIAITMLLRSPAWAQDASAYQGATGPQGASGTQTASGSQGWRVTPSLSVGEHYSDNVSLAPAGSQRSEWTTRINPAVSLTGNSARLRLTANYSPEFLYRAQQGTTDISHYLNVLGNAELFSRTLFLDVQAGITQQNVSLLGPQAESNINTTNNRTTTKTYSVSPYLRHEFGVDAIGELRFTHDALNYGGNSGAVSSSTSERIDAKLGSGPAYKLFVWNIALSKSHVEYSQSGQKIDAQSYSLSGGRLITPDLRLNASYGYEDSGYPSTAGQDLAGSFWSVGPEWTPTERTRISASFGRRYYGPSRALSISHRASLAFLGVDYSESVTNTRNNFTAAISDTSSATAICQAFFPDPAKRPPQCVTDISRLLTVPVDFLTDSLFLEKRFQTNFGIQGLANTVTASVFSSNRRSITTGTSGGVAGDFNSNLNVKQTGASVTWASRLTQALASNATLSVTRNTFDGQNRTDRLTAFRVGLTKEFNPKLSGALTLGRVKSDSSAASTSYTENSASATLGMKF